ncbi:ATP-dependent helicase [Prolixibacteraceae bacterium]|nr:ATP-dependent helicase [Prolixibacteraceae bacterium]
MPNLVEVSYQQTGKSKSNNALGMREMQARAYAKRAAQYLLIKSPPASGKSRALMFLGLDKLRRQGVKKVVVAVPEKSIGGSFAPTALMKYGFFADWSPEDRHNLCTPGAESSKTNAMVRFMKEETSEILICTHATLRFAYDKLTPQDFNDTLVAIDEFHHVSQDADNRLGEVLKSLMDDSSAHIVAMTGSYFRGDAVPVMGASDEAKFEKVTYSYYEQLNGYDYLKTLGIGYHFYSGRYTDAIGEVLDLNKKTIIHIPNVNSSESTKRKYHEVDTIYDLIGSECTLDEETGLHLVTTADGRVVRVADLVNDQDEKRRTKVQDTLRKVSRAEDVDIIIALGMAKEGFDWPYCEHALTVGYRGSLTEVVQIIGRATRDCEGKIHAQFTNLIAQPEADDDEVKYSVNNMLKAINVSLLMEQVLAPNFKFKTKKSEHDSSEAGTIKIKGFKEPSTAKVSQILENDLNDLKAVLVQDGNIQASMSGDIDPEVVNKVTIPKIIRTKYPELSEEEVEEVRQHVVADNLVRYGDFETKGGREFVKMGDRFVDIEDLHIDLIDQVNPFQKAFEVLSKSVSAPMLKTIHETIQAKRIRMDFEEARLLWPKIKSFRATHGREPRMDAVDVLEKRMAECIVYLKAEKKRMAQEQRG